MLPFFFNTWPKWEMATCWPDNCFCEQISPNLIKQKSNTWSSLAFVLVALIIVQHSLLSRRQKSNKNTMTSSLIFPLIYAFAVNFTGLGSAFYHASLSFIAQFFDVLGMYFISCFIIVYNLIRKYNLSRSLAVLSYTILILLLSLFLWFIPELRRYLFALTILIALVLEYLYLKNARTILNISLLKKALLFIAIGFIFWLLDINKIFFSPSSFLQGHALWHICGAISGLYLYSYYRSEMVK